MDEEELESEEDVDAEDEEESNDFAENFASDSD